MNVRLVSYSQPTAEFRTHGIEDAQELIAYCARVSNPANQLNTETSETHQILGATPALEPT